MPRRLRRRGRRGGAKRLRRPRAAPVLPRFGGKRRTLGWAVGGLAVLLAGIVALNLRHAPPPQPIPRPSVAVLPPAPLPPAPPPLRRELEPPLPPPSPQPVVAPAWLRFAMPAPDSGRRPRVAIVIDDCGLDRSRTERAIALPAPVTLSFLPYAEDLPRQTAAAHRAGHELLVHVPMQPINMHTDMGPNGLAVDQPREEVLRRLRWDLDRFEGYVGINNHMGSRFTANPEAMHWVLAELKARGLMFLDSRTIGNSTGEIVAAVEAVPFAGRDVFLDDDQDASAVEARLRDVEAVARKKGTAIAIGHPHDATLAALNSWIANLPRLGFAIVPLTDIVKARMPVE